ncbi:MAG: hypothetical protein BalsKO_11510 [Balneolaceae bacterium]
MKTGISFLLFVLIISTSHSFSQEIIDSEIPCRKQSSNKECDEGWFTIGIGGDKNFDFSGMVSANFGRNHFWGLKLYSATNLCLGECPDAPGFASISVSKGYSIVDRVGRFAVSLGPSIVIGKKTIDEERFFTPGLVTNLQFIITPFKDFGFGIDFFSDINPKLSTYGVALTLVIEGHK